MTSRSPLDDPQTASFAWARYRKIMRGVVVATLAVVIVVLLAVYDAQSEASVHYYIAIALGIGGVMLLAGALMGLVFLSSGTGHDQSIDN